MLMIRIVRRSLLVALTLLLISSLASFGDGSRLVVGDVVTIEVDGEKDFTKDYQIGNDGTVLLPQEIAPVKIEGLNTSEAAAVLTKAISKVLVNPQVTVTFKSRARMQVYVVGQVNKPGLTEIGLGDRVLQALAQVGYNDTADLSRINVRRDDQVIDVDLTKYLSAEDLNTNVELRSGDTVVVPRMDSIGSVLVLGQVGKVGSVPIRRGMTFRDLMGLIGGVTVEADVEKITIKRENSTDSIPVNYKQAMEADPTADIVLQPNDTIFVAQIETAFFTVMGGVNRPTQYPLKSKLTLSEAIGLAGGPIPNVGDTRKIQIIRAGASKEVPGTTMLVNLQDINQKGLQEPLVMRGDVINVGIHKQREGVFDLIRNILPLGWLFRR